MDLRVVKGLVGEVQAGDGAEVTPSLTSTYVADQPQSGVKEVLYP